MNFQRRRGGVVGLSLGGLLRAAVISLLIGAGASTAQVSEWGCRGSSAAETFTCADGSTVDVTGCVASASSVAALRCLVEEYTVTQTTTTKELTVYLDTSITLNAAIAVPAGAHVALIGTTSAADDSATPEGWPGAALPPTTSVSGGGSVRLFDVVGPKLDVGDGAYSQFGDGNTTLLLRNLVLEDGKASVSGGIVYALGANVYVDGCIVRGGEVVPEDIYGDARGGAIFFAFYDQLTDDHAATDAAFALDIQGSLFYDNKAGNGDSILGSSQGGAVFASKYYDTSKTTPTVASSVTVRDSTFRDNEAYQTVYFQNGGGGALFTVSDETGLVHVAMLNVTVDGNEGRVGGAFYLGLGTTAELDLVTFTNNLSPGAGPLTGGGGIFAAQYASVELNRVVATNNSVAIDSAWPAGPAGGGFIFASEWSEVNMFDSTCSYNSAPHHGGCVTADAANLNIYRSELSHNYAGRFGAEVMVVDGKLFTYGSTYKNTNRRHEGTETGYLVHGSGSELSFDSSTLEGYAGEGYETHLVGSILSDADVVVRNSEVRGPVGHYSTDNVDGATEEPYQELSAVDDAAVQSCAALAGADSMEMEIELKCSSGYCSDSSLVGIDCYCDTLFGPRDPTWEGCDDPPALVVLQETYSVYARKPDVLKQTFFFKNDGEELLHWTVAPVDMPAGQAVRYYPTSGNLTSCTMGNLTVEVPSYTIDAYTNYEVVLDLVSTAYPYKVSPDFTTLTAFNTTVRVRTDYFIAAAVNATNSFLVNGTTLGLIEESEEAFAAAAAQNVTLLSGTAGWLLEAAIVPVDDAGLWIRGSPGAEKYAATLAREDGDDEVVCEVGFDADADVYKVKCFLDDFLAGLFHLDIDLLVARASDGGYDAVRVSGAGGHLVEVTVDCASGFKQMGERLVTTTTASDGETTSVTSSGADTGRYTCGCGKGSYLDVSNAECKACQSGKFGRNPATIYKPDVCISCGTLFEGPITTVVQGATTADECVCSPAYFKRQTKFNVTHALMNYGILGECEACPEGTLCPDYAHEVEDWVVEPGYWRAANSSLNVYECRETPNDDWKSSCVGSMGNTSGKYTLCGTGYDGPLCSKCSFDYYRDVSGFCYHCKGIDATALINWTIFMLVCFFIVGPILVFYLFRKKKRMQALAQQKQLVAEERRSALMRLQLFSDGGFTSEASDVAESEGQDALSINGGTLANKEGAAEKASAAQKRRERSQSRRNILEGVADVEALDAGSKRMLLKMEEEEKAERLMVVRAMEVTEKLTDRQLAVEMVRYEMKLAQQKQDEIFGVEEQRQKELAAQRLRRVSMLAKSSASLARDATKILKEDVAILEKGVKHIMHLDEPKPKIKLKATATVAPADAGGTRKPVLKAKAVALKSSAVAPLPQSSSAAKMIGVEMPTVAAAPMGRVTMINKVAKMKAHEAIEKAEEKKKKKNESKRYIATGAAGQKGQGADADNKGVLSRYDSTEAMEVRERLERRSEVNKNNAMDSMERNAGLGVKRAKEAADVASAAGMAQVGMGADDAAMYKAVAGQDAPSADGDEQIVVNADDLLRDAFSIFASGELFEQVARDIQKAFSSMLKSISNELQLTCKFTMSVDVKMPTVFRGFIGVINLVNLDFASLLPMECFTGWSYNYHTTVVLNTVFPAFTMGFILLLYKVCAASGEYHDLKHNWMMVGLLFLHFNYANLCNTIFKLFACEDYDYGDDGYVSLLQEDLTIMCMSNRHRAMQMYGIVALFIFPIGVPMMYLSIMNYHRTRMDYTYYRSHIKNGFRLNEQQLYRLRASDPVTRSFGFLYSQYNSSNYWFEVVECGRKMLLCGLVVLLAPGTPSQYTMCMLTFFVLFTFIAYFRPYHSDMDSQIALVCYVTTFVTYVVTFLTSYEIDSKAKLSDAAVTGLLFTATVLPLLAGLKCFYDQASDQYQAYRQRTNAFNAAIDSRVKLIQKKRDELKIAAGSAAAKWLQKIGKTPHDKHLATRRQAHKEEVRKRLADAERERLVVEGVIDGRKSPTTFGQKLAAAGNGVLSAVAEQVSPTRGSPTRDGGSGAQFAQLAIGTHALEHQEEVGFGRADGDGLIDSSARRAATHKPTGDAPVDGGAPPPPPGGLTLDVNTQGGGDGGQGSVGSVSTQELPPNGNVML